MSFLNGFRRPAAWAAILLLSLSLPLQAQRSGAGTAASENDPEWRTWTSGRGATIEAYLKAVTPEGIVIVRRDGREFTAPLSRFSAEDRAYVATRTASLANESGRNPGFRNPDEANVPKTYAIQGVANLRRASREPLEATALRTILSFHNIPIPDGFAAWVATREPEIEIEAIAAPELTTILANFPVTTEIVAGGGYEDVIERWDEILPALKAAIAQDLPVLLAYRPNYDLDTFESVVVAVAYDAADFKVFDPLGRSSTVSLDLESLSQQFVYGLIVRPTVAAASGDSLSSESSPSREFLSQISSAILNVPTYEPKALTDYLREVGIQATIRDVNRLDYHTQMGRTRSFARVGGLPLIDASLGLGNILIVPLTLGSEQAFALLYGKSDEGYLGVRFLPDRTFERAPITPGDLARNWMTRADRTYRLDLIEITVPPGGGPVPPPAPTREPPGAPPAYRPPPPPGR